MAAATSADQPVRKCPPMRRECQKRRPRVNAQSRCVHVESDNGRRATRRRAVCLAALYGLPSINERPTKPRRASCQGCLEGIDRDDGRPSKPRRLTYERSTAVHDSVEGRTAKARSPIIEAWLRILRGLPSRTTTVSIPSLHLSMPRLPSVEDGSSSLGSHAFEGWLPSHEGFEGRSTKGRRAANEPWKVVRLRDESQDTRVRRVTCQADPVRRDRR